MSDPKFPVERPDLTRLPFRALGVVAKVIESGDRKYQAGDWIMAEQRIDGRRDLNSALRHIGEFIEGKDVDEDSGESPLAHAAARLLFLLEREARGIKGGGWRIGKGEVTTQATAGNWRDDFMSIMDAIHGPDPRKSPRIVDVSAEDGPAAPVVAPGEFDIHKFRGAMRFCPVCRDRDGRPFFCDFDKGHEGPHSFTVSESERAEGGL